MREGTTRAPQRLKEKKCPCGETFMPRAPAQKYHAADCPAKGGEVKAKPKVAKPAPAITSSESSLLGDLRARCESEAARLTAEIERLTSERDEVTRAAEALA